MSAANVIVQRNVVHLYTDGAAFDADGNVIWIGSKVSLCPNIPCAIAFRGSAMVSGILAAEIEGASGGSFDRLRKEIGGRLLECSKRYTSYFQSCEWGPEFDVVVAGWSETDGPSAYRVSSHEQYGDAWVVQGLDGLSCLPGDESIRLRMVEIVKDVADTEELLPLDHGLAIMQAQRAPVSHFGGRSHTVVGGFCQLTSITRAAISTRVLHRWPDQIGSAIPRP
jgi:hypothetical protein